MEALNHFIDNNPNITEKGKIKIRFIDNLLRMNGKIQKSCLSVDQFKIRVSEPEPGASLKIDGSETLRLPVDILLFELMKAYIFDHSRNITKKFIHESTIF